ncbi:MAG: hypothetical protein ABEH47_06580 [Haloferacaceae archaeon]
MRRTATILLAALVVVGTLGVVPTTGVAQQTTDSGTATATPTDGGAEENETDANATAPGDVLEGVVGVQEAEMEGAIENRTFGIQIAQAATDDAKAEVVKERLTAIEERLKGLEDRKQELEEARENGSISASEYRAEIAQLAARTNNTKQLANRSANVSEGLPNETLQANGINVTAIRTLQERADELTGPEVSKIARSIAGPSVTEKAPKAAERRGPPSDGADAGASEADRSGNRTAAGGSQATETPDRPDGGSGGNETADGGSTDESGGDAGGANGGSADGRP